MPGHISEPSRRPLRNQELKVHVKALFVENRGLYGRLRLVRELREKGLLTSRKRVQRIMREANLSARLPRKFRKTTDSSHHLEVAKNILQRDFAPKAPNEVWASDISYVPTWQGWSYVAVVIDLFSRRVLGWTVASHLRTALPKQALDMALRLRRPPRGLVHHSDRGVQYASNDYQASLKRHGLIPSMRRKGDCWDNAPVESFFATLK